MAGCTARKHDVVVTEATFGLFRTREAGQVALERSDVVPRVPGQQYGWLIRIKTDRERVRWREELRLPDAPATWGRERIGKRHLSADGRTLTTEREVAARSGYIFNAWKVEAGDPPGRYTMSVAIEQGPTQRFVFVVK